MVIIMVIITYVIIMIIYIVIIINVNIYRYYFFICRRHSEMTRIHKDTPATPAILIIGKNHTVTLMKVLHTE